MNIQFMRQVLQDRGLIDELADTGQQLECKLWPQMLTEVLEIGNG